MTNPSTPVAAIGRSALPGIPERSSRQLLALLTAHPQLEAIWLFGSRAMDRYQPGSDIDDLLLPWRLDLLLMHQLDAEGLHLDAPLIRLGSPEHTAREGL
jgi:hypothetical protein